MSRLCLAVSLLVHACAGALEESPSASNCAFWCRLHPKPWATKCKWQRSCAGCDVCGPAKGCLPWCAKSDAPWGKKCKYEACDGCEVCGPSTCKPFCQSNTQPWATKCKWQTCDGCDSCGGASSSPSPSPVSPPVSFVPSPPPSPVTSPPPRELPGWFTSDEQCGQDPTDGSLTFTCNRDEYAPMFRDDQSQTSPYPGGQGPLHWPPGSFISSLVEVVESDGSRTAVLTEDAWFGPRIGEAIIGEVVAADPINCAESHMSYTTGSPHPGPGYITNAAELAGKIVLCQRGDEDDPVHFSEMNLFVSYNVPTAKAVLVMNKKSKNEADKEGIRGMMDGYNVCEGYADKWGDKLRSEVLYEKGCTTPFISVTEASGQALIGKTVAITPADEAMVSELTINIANDFYSEFNGLYVTLPKRCSKPQFGRDTLDAAYAVRTPSNYNFCYDNGSSGCATNQHTGGATASPCTIGTCDLAANRIKYVLKSDLDAGLADMHYLTYVLKYGGTQVDSYTSIKTYLENENTEGTYGGWVLGKWKTEALRSSRCEDLWRPEESETWEDAYPAEANVQWAYLHQEDKYGAAQKYPTTKSWEAVMQFLPQDSDCEFSPPGPDEQPCGPSGDPILDEAPDELTVTLDPPAQDLASLPEFPTTLHVPDQARRRQLSGAATFKSVHDNKPASF